MNCKCSVWILPGIRDHRGHHPDCGLHADNVIEAMTEKMMALVINQKNAMKYLITLNQLAQRANDSVEYFKTKQIIDTFTSLVSLEEMHAINVTMAQRIKDADLSICGQEETSEHCEKQEALAIAHNINRPN